MRKLLIISFVLIAVIVGLKLTPVASALSQTIQDKFAFTCNPANGGQLCATDHTKTFNMSSAGVANATYKVAELSDGIPLDVNGPISRHCSSVRVFTYVDNILVGTTPYLGWVSPPTSDPQNRPLNATLFNNLNLSAGSHTIRLKAEGQLGGCNVGNLVSWGGTMIVQTSTSPLNNTGADLIAYSPAIVHATAGTPVPLMGVLQNIGGSPTGSYFDNVFQIATSPNGGGSVSNVPTIPAIYNIPESINPGQFHYVATSILSFPSQGGHVFSTPGVYSIRLCADNDVALIGTINETNENNNCSPWRNITVEPTDPLPTFTADAIPNACGINVSWNTLAGATSYKVFRSSSANGSYTFLDTVASSQGSYPDAYSLKQNRYAFNDKNGNSLNPGGVYFYKVEAYNTGGFLGTTAPDSAISPVNCHTLPDLIASPPTPSVATGGTPMVFYTTYQNIGGASTGSSNGTPTFPVLFQVADGHQGAGTVTNVHGTGDQSTMVAGEFRNSSSSSWTFQSAKYPLPDGTYNYSVRACVDTGYTSGPITKTPKIIESNENNNCSPWTDGEVKVVTHNATLRATKVVCDSEADLPNWGDTKTDANWYATVNDTTASDWVAQSAGKCRFQSGWNFEWAGMQSYTAPFTREMNPGNQIEVAGGRWKAFGPTNANGVATVQAPLDEWNKTFLVREQFKSGYIPYSGNSTDSVSAEMICYNDPSAYDNYSIIWPAYWGGTFDCVSFGVAQVVANNPPIANAGLDQTITLPTSSASLNGSLSTDSDGTIVSYVWSQVSGPSNVNPNDTVITTASPLVAGTYVFSLTVTDDDGATNTDTMSVMVNPAVHINNPPIANAGPDQGLFLPVNSTTLNGSGSTDSDGTIVSYVWTMDSGPSNINPVDTVITTVNNPVAGTYIFRLTVTDNDGATSTDTVSVIIVPAECYDGFDNNDQEDTLIDSADPGCHTDRNVNNPNSYVPTDNDESNPVAECSDGFDNNDPEDSLIDSKDPGCHSDGDANNLVSWNPNDNDETDIIPNVAPIADAGVDENVTLPFAALALNGSGSTDSDGTIVSYVWDWVSGPNFINPADDVTPAFGGLVAGTYVFSLTVTDDDGATSMDTVSVIVNPALPPKCSDGIDNPDPEDTLADASDPGCHTDRNVNNPNSYDPNDDSELNVSLQCSDGIDNADPEDTLVDSKDPGCHTDGNANNINSWNPNDNDETDIIPNVAPVANAGIDQTITLPTSSANLNGSLSTDSDGTIVSYVWNWVSGPSNVNPADTVTTTASPLVAGTYVFSLTVTDDDSANNTDFMSVIVNPAVVLPQCSDGIDNADAEDTLVDSKDPGCHFDNNVNNPNSYEPNDNSESNDASHQCSDGIDNADTEDILIDSADPGCHTDGNAGNPNSWNPNDNSENDVVMIPLNIAPTANAGIDQTITLPTSSATLNGSLSTDSDGTIVSYVWNQVSGPNVVNPADVVSPSISGLVAGTYVFELTVTDDDGATNTDSMSVIVNPVVVVTPQCSDGVDNADTEDTLVDANDPGCHSDGNVNNGNSYVPTDTDESNTSAQCADGIDNADPEDTLVDSQDPGCHTDGNVGNPLSWNPTDNDETDVVVPKTECADGIDNADPEDTLVDANDPGCHSDGNVNNGASYVPTDISEANTSAQCADGIDNNDTEDTLVDSNDPGCHTDADPNNPATWDPTDTNETNSQCSDKIDNDSDGEIDYGKDPGCDNLSDDDETNSSGGGGGGGSRRKQCSDNKDNDKDGLEDERDPGCHSDGNPNNPNSYVRNDNNETNGEVLGETSCGIYVDKYLRKGYANNPDTVRKVQIFLNDYTGAKLVVDGIYGTATELAVYRFQLAHSDKILRPWGITVPTGIFYLTTQTEVNNIMCSTLNLPIPSNLINFSQNPTTPPFIGPVRPAYLN